MHHKWFRGTIYIYTYIYIYHILKVLYKTLKFLPMRETTKHGNKPNTKQQLRYYFERLLKRLFCCVCQTSYGQKFLKLVRNLTAKKVSTINNIAHILIGF